MVTVVQQDIGLPQSFSEAYQLESEAMHGMYWQCSDYLVFGQIPVILEVRSVARVFRSFHLSTF